MRNPFKITRNMMYLGVLVLGITFVGLNIIVGAKPYFLYIGLGLVGVYFYLRLRNKR